MTRCPNHCTQWLQGQQARLRTAHLQQGRIACPIYRDRGNIGCICKHRARMRLISICEQALHFQRCPKTPAPICPKSSGTSPRAAVASRSIDKRSSTPVLPQSGDACRASDPSSPSSATAAYQAPANRPNTSRPANGKQPSISKRRTQNYAPLNKQSLHAQFSPGLIPRSHPLHKPFSANCPGSTWQMQ